MFHQLKVPDYAPQNFAFSSGFNDGSSPTVSTPPPKEQAVAMQSLGTMSTVPLQEIVRVCVGSDRAEEVSKEEWLHSGHRPGSLNLRKLHLQKLPEGFVKVPIQTLFLDETELTELPESCKELSDLQTLSAEKNKLTTLPQSLSELPALEFLNASHNKIQLPDTFPWPKALKYLFLSDNGLTTLPESLKDQPLKELHIRHNPLIVDEKLRRILLSLKASGCNINCDQEVGRQFSPPIVWEKTSYEICS